MLKAFQFKKCSKSRKLLGQHGDYELLCEITPPHNMDSIIFDQLSLAYDVSQKRQGFLLMIKVS